MKISYLVALSSTILFWSCTTHTTLEGPVAVRATEGSQPSTSARVNSTPATSAEVNAALHRIFADAVSATSQHSFATGDFNGDGSPDLAALVQPEESKLKSLNDPLANWTIQDATHAFFPPADQRVVFMPPKPTPPSAHAHEVLLAVIHGYGQNGWRNPQALQAYLVRHAGTGPIEARHPPEHIAGAPASIKQSEIIFEPAQKPGFLFWTGSQYAWRSGSVN
jgi:hypothetical protein